MKTHFIIGIYIYIISAYFFSPKAFSQGFDKATTDIRPSYFDHGSIAIVFVRGDTITLGADSRVITGGGVISDNNCKILIADDIVFAKTGIAKIINVDVDSVAKNILHSSGDIKKKLRDIETFSKEIIRSFLLNNPIARDSITQSETFRNNLSINFMLCTFMHRIPMIYERHISAYIKKNCLFVDTVDSYDRWYGKSWMGVFQIGIDYSGLKLIERNGSLWQGINPIEAIKMIIEEQKSRRIEIGGFIDVAQFVQGKKPKWIYRKPCCQD